MIRQRRGNSIIELLVAMAIVVIAFTAMTGYVIGLKKQTQKILLSRSRSTQLQKVVQMIMTDPKLFKVNFDRSEKATCAALENSTLPLGWDGNSLADIVQCPGCLGRMGYVIQPFPLAAVRGVYLVTIRMTHPTQTLGVTTFCNGVAINNTDQIQMIVSLR